MKDDRRLDREERAHFGLAPGNLINDIIRKANVIVTTLSNTEEPSLVINFLSNVIILDEATLAVEPDMWNIFGNYDLRYMYSRLL